MRWRMASTLLLAALAALGLSAQPALAADIPVMAFYYPWYNPTDFSLSKMWDVPATPYQSDDRGAIQRQVQQASGAGITGFISSWWGKGNRTDKNLATLLNVSKGTSFASTIYFEAGAPGLDSPGAIVSQLQYVTSTYGSNPNLARIGGKPALFFWNPTAVGDAATWQAIRSQVDPNGAWHWNVETDRPNGWLNVFDGVHLFSAASWTSDATSTYKNLKTQVDNFSASSGQEKWFAAGVAPGWDNSHQDNPTQVKVDRQGGAYYSNRWDSAIASEAPIITITSWNEWGEGTEVEPGTSYGNLYLDITKRYTSRFMPAPRSTGIVFRLGFKLLADQIGRVAGQPVENEHYGANGDSLQQTTAGLMVWRKADNWTAFTDGATTWVNGPNGVQSRPNSVRFSWEAQ